MAVVLMTGTVATVSHEIDWLVQDDMRASPAQAIIPGEKVSWSEMEDALRDYRPDDTLQSIYKIGGDHFTYRARMRDEFGQMMFVHVDPWTGTVTGETNPLTVQRVFRDLHRYLFMPNYIGLPLVTSLAFILMIALYTGLKTTRNWRTILFRVRTNKGSRILIGDAHKAAGLWSVWFFVVMITTSVWYLAEFGAAAAGQRMSPSGVSAPAEAVTLYGATINTPPLDDVIAAAINAYPELKPTSVGFPSGANGTLTVQGSAGNPLVRQRANMVFLNPETLEVLKVRRARDIRAVAFINEMADPLHFGYFGGLATKLIWFVFGLLMSGLSLSGVWLTWKRLKTASPSKTQFATLPVLLLSFYFFTQWYGRFQSPERPKDEIAFIAMQTQDSIAATLFVSDFSETEKRLRFRLQSDQGLIKARDLVVTLGDEQHKLRLSTFGEVSSTYLTLPIGHVSDDMPIKASLGTEGGPQTVWKWN
jgi:uncharacterized iron-regulated membrane protein